jgi:hypothetical protein
VGDGGNVLIAQFLIWLNFSKPSNTRRSKLPPPGIYFCSDIDYPNLPLVNRMPMQSFAKEIPESPCKS